MARRRSNPGQAAVRRVKRKLATEMRRLRWHNASAVLAAICPITRGWGGFSLVGGGQADVDSVDDYLWELTRNRT